MVFFYIKFFQELYQSYLKHFLLLNLLLLILGQVLSSNQLNIVLVLISKQIIYIFLHKIKENNMIIYQLLFQIKKS
jgi:hypothetical protein